MITLTNYIVLVQLPLTYLSTTVVSGYSVAYKSPVVGSTDHSSALMCLILRLYTCKVTVECWLQALPYVFLLIVMLFFIYAVIGMQVASYLYTHLVTPVLFLCVTSLKHKTLQ